MPLASSARLCAPPPATAVTKLRPLTGTGTLLSALLEPSPSWRERLLPHATALYLLVATVSVAALVVVLPPTLVKVARYSLLFSPVVVASMVRTGAVASAIALQLEPWLTETSHCTVGSGNPLAVASKVAFSPAFTVVLAGCAVITGGECTVSVADSLVALPAALVNTAR